MDIVRNTSFAPAMDRPRARQRFGKPMLIGGAAAALALAAVGWVVLAPAERSLRVEIGRAHV